jgi:hypothetical protein
MDLMDLMDLMDSMDLRKDSTLDRLFAPFGVPASPPPGLVAWSTPPLDLRSAHWVPAAEQAMQALGR